jgi:hypothetical protein
MTVGAALKQGFGLARRFRSVVWIIFLINLGLAALVALPIYRGILCFTGHSLISQTLLYGFSSEWLTDFIFNSPGSLDRYAALIGLVGLLAIPVNTLLAGGVLGRLRRPPEQMSSLGDFFRDTFRFAWRLLRLMLISLICYWTVFRLLNQGLGHLAKTWTHEWQNEHLVFWVQLVPTLLTLIALAFANLVMDFARVRLVLEDGASAAEACLASLGFSIGRLREALVVYAVPMLCGVALLILYRLLLPWSVFNTPASPGGAWAQYCEPLTLALLFLIQQAVMFGRYWFRVATWASEWSYYSDSK